MWHHDPVAPEQFDIAALCVGGKDALRSALETVEFPRDECLQGELIVLELRNFNLETLFFCKVAGRYHHEDTGIGLHVNQPVLPDLFLCHGRKRQAGKDRGDSHYANGDLLKCSNAHGEVPPGTGRPLTGLYSCTLTSILSQWAFPSALCGTSLWPASAGNDAPLIGRVRRKRPALKFCSGS